MAVAPDVTGFGEAVAVELHDALGSDLVAACFVGSVALGGYVAGESDIDILAVCERRPTSEQKDAIARGLLRTAASCPARGLEFSLYRREVVARPPSGADFEVNVNGGPRMDRTVRFNSDDQPGFWYLLDRAIAHRHGLAIFGPPPSEICTDVPRPMLLDAMAQSMRWHRQHESTTHYSVLNGSRAWRFAAEDVLGSKLEGAAWARQRWRSPSLIDAAVDLRHGRPGTLDAAEVGAFLKFVEEVLADALV